MKVSAVLLVISLVFMATVTIIPTRVSAATQITVAFASDFTTFSEATTLANMWAAKTPTLSIAVGDLGYGSSVSSWCSTIWNGVTSGDAILNIGSHDTDNPDRLTNNNGVGSTGTWEGASGYANTCGLKGTGIVWHGSGTTSNSRACDTSASLSSIYTCFGREGYFDYPNVNPVARFITTCDGINSTPNATVWCNYIGGQADGNNHFTWLNSTITAARNAGEWVIVLNHVENWNGFEGVQYDDKFWSDLIQNKVDLIIMGGNHAYERSYPLTCSKTNSGVDWYQSANATNTACIASTNPNTYAKGLGSIYLTDGDLGQSFHNFCQFGTIPDTDITGATCSTAHFTDWKSNSGYFAVNNDTTWGFNYMTITPTGLTSTYINCPNGTCDYSSTGIPARTRGGFSDTFTIGTLNPSSNQTPPPNGKTCPDPFCPNAIAAVGTIISGIPDWIFWSFLIAAIAITLTAIAVTTKSEPKRRGSK